MQTDRLAIDLIRAPIHLSVMKVAFGAPRGAPVAEVDASCQIRKEAAGRTRRNGSADLGPSAYHTDAGKAQSLSAAAPVNGRRWRLPGMRTRDLRLLKTLKTATVASTPLAIW